MPSRSTRPLVPSEVDDLQRSLAFVNTLSARPTSAPQERLLSYDALCSWSVESGILDTDLAATLTARARRRASDADAVLRRTRDLREQAHAALEGLSSNRSPAAAALDALAEQLAPWYRHGRLVRDHLALQWADGDDDGLDAPLWRIARAVARTLTSPLIARVRPCAADDCGWWFVDDTKNRSRRWCDMKSCGNRAKVRAFRARAR